MHHHWKVIFSPLKIATALFYLVLPVIFLLSIGGCDGGQSVTETPASDDRPPELTAAVDLPYEGPLTMTGFAEFNPAAVTVTPSIEHAAIAPDLGNVKIAMALSAKQLERLAKDGVVASPGLQEKEFFTLYEKARYANIPIFITSDSLLHSYHLLFSKVLRTAESEFFHPLLNDLNEALFARLDQFYAELQGGPWEEEALRTAAFIAVGGKLADPAFPVPDYCKDLVEAEFALIEAADGIHPSPLFPGLEMGEDYSQYKPRGHYTKSEALEAYFKNMMWYGRMTFRLDARAEGVAERETRMALLLVKALRNTGVGDRHALAVWSDLYDPTSFLVGRSDDLTVFDYMPLIDQVYGENPDLSTLVDEERLTAFLAASKEMPQPEILGLVLYEAEDVATETRGLRFMGQRFVADAYIFGQLTYDQVSDDEKRRGLPNGLDLFAAMGSPKAYQLLEGMNETTYLNYPEQMEKMQTWTASLSEDDWTETVYNAWLYTFYPLLEQHGEGYPQFMRSPAWQVKQLHTSLGSWAELKHDTILYAKQTYAEMGDGWSPTPPDPLPARGYVEPVPAFYSRLAALAAMTREGLAERNLLNNSDAESLKQIEDLALFLKETSEKQLAGVPLAFEEHARIRYYGGELEQLVMAAADSETLGADAISYMDEDPQAAVIADVATDLRPQGLDFSEPAALQVGVGRINDIHVIVPLVENDGSLTLQVAKGGIFSYYEFPWPASDRLTDEKWQALLDEGSNPPPPTWIESFYVSEGEEEELRRAISSFQRAWVEAVFYLSDRHIVSDYHQYGGGSALEKVRAEIATLQSQKRFEGRKLLGTDFRSYDRQSPTLAVVTVRESWEDILYGYEGPEHPAQSYDEEDMQELGKRGPYDINITYSLELDEEQGWLVTRIVTGSLRPAW